MEFAKADRFAMMFSFLGNLKKFFAGSPVIENGTAAAMGAAFEHMIDDY